MFNNTKRQQHTGHDVIHALLAAVGVETAGRRRLFRRKVVLRVLQNLGHAFEQGEIAATNVIVVRCVRQRTNMGEQRAEGICETDESRKRTMNGGMEAMNSNEARNATKTKQKIPVVGFAKKEERGQLVGVRA